MSVQQKPVRIAARMYEMRDHAKTLLGDKYAETMARYREIIETNQKREGGTDMDATLRILKKLDKANESPFLTIYFTAAFVEMTAPSPALAQATSRKTSP